MKKTLTLLVAGLLALSSAFAQETPKWIRQNAISPDGAKIAFCYKGDIYVVDRDGKNPIQITTNPAYDADPIWTKDGKNLIFSSDREKAQNLFIVSSEGGVPKKINTFGGMNTPLCILPDGRILFFSSVINDAKFGGFPSEPQLYAVDVKGGAPERITSLYIPSIQVFKNGTTLYEDYKGYEDPFRKHHTSSVTRDIWLYKPAEGQKEYKIDENGTFTKLSDYIGEDRNPVFGADGDTFYYLSERDGKTSNIYQSSISNPKKNIQLTTYTKNPVRYLSISDNGILSFSYNGELYTMVPGKEPKKVEMTIRRDENERDVIDLNMQSGATSMAISPDEKQIAVVLRGDVFVTSADYKTTKRITNTASQERNVSFSEDGRALYYSAERDGHWGIYRAVLADKNDKYFVYAHDIKEELFSVPGETSFQPEVSPDGKWVAYLRNRTELVIKSTKKNEVKSLLKDINYSYSDGDLSFAWSPDSKYLLSDYQANGGWNHNDIALINIDNGEIVNLTESGYVAGNFKWTLKGNAITYESDKNGYRSHGSWGAESDVYIMFFNGKSMTEFLQDKEDAEVEKLLSGKSEKQLAKEEKKEKKDSIKNKMPEVVMDLANRYDRIIKLTPSSARLGDYYLNNTATKLYYVAPSESGYALYVRDLKDGNVKLMMRGVSGNIVPSKDGNNIYILNRGGVSKVSLLSGQTKNIAFLGEFEYKPKGEREYMFNHIWKQVKEKFYDPEIHGVDWEYYRDNYAQFLPYINNNIDFAMMLSEMLGELNGSHTGARCRRQLSVFNSYLGFFPDETYKGDGVKIKEVLIDGPTNIADAEIGEGDIIEAINGTPIKEGDNWRELLLNKANKKIFITVKKGRKSEDLLVTPTRNLYTLLYRRWVKQREDMVTKLSGGKVGYVHVEGMNSPSFREVYSKALGKYRNCDALIVDTRHNGGGWLHDDLATLLSGKAYLEFKPRGQYMSTEPFAKWTKPSCVLISEDNYSDASGFPYVYKTLGIGKLIGAPVPGTMTAVWWESQINPSIIFGIPQVGSWGLKEKRYLENLQVEPDVLIYDNPKDQLSGKDIQLEAAVKEMLKTIKDGQ